MWSDAALSVLKPIWVLSQIFGMCNRAMDEKIKKEPRSLSKTIFSYFYVIAALTVITFLTYSTSDFNVDPRSNIVIQLADLLFNLTNNMSMISTVICCLFRQDAMTTLARRLYNIDKELKKMIKWNSYKSTKIFIVTCLVFTLAIWMSFFVYYVIVLCPNSTPKCLRNWVIIYTSTKISQVLLVTFCALVAILRHNVNVVNSNIKELFKEQNHRLKSMHDVFYEKTLTEIERNFNEILTACSEVQTIFSVPLLMKTASQFVGIFCCLYFSVFGYTYNGQFIKPKSFGEFIIPLTTMIIAVVELLTTVTVCELAISEIKNTGKLIYRISLPKNNVAIMKKINLFSLQLIHKNFEFNASGFFKINGSLLQTIVGAVTVYLVMFIQFDIATNKQSA